MIAMEGNELSLLHIQKPAAKVMATQGCFWIKICLFDIQKINLAYDIPLVILLPVEFIPICIHASDCLT